MMDPIRLGAALTVVVKAGTTPTPNAADSAVLLTFMTAQAVEIIKEIDLFLEATGTTLVVGGSSAGTHVTTIPIGGAS